MLQRLKQCRKCGISKPFTTKHFNLLSSGYWRGSCKKCMAENTKRHYYKDKEKVMARVRKYKETKKTAPGYCSDRDIAQIRASLDDRCYYCGDELNGGGEVDHVRPIVRGGTNWPNNLTLVCRTCNRDKHAKNGEEFLAWRRRLGLKIREDMH